MYIKFRNVSYVLMIPMLAATLIITTGLKATPFSSFPVEGYVASDDPTQVVIHFVEQVQRADGGMTLEHIYFDGDVKREYLTLAMPPEIINHNRVVLRLQKSAPLTGILRLQFNARQGKIVLKSKRPVPDFSIIVHNKTGLVQKLPPSKKRTWLGPNFWANRLQDWQLRYGKIECVQPGPDRPVRTAHIVTREVVQGRQPFHLSARMGTLAVNNGNGWSGFLIGAGAGKLDYRAAAMVFAGPGKGGGILCVMDMKGELHFRSNSDETSRKPYPDLDYEILSGKSAARNIWEDIQLDLDVVPNNKGSYNLFLSAWNFISGEFMGGIVSRNQQEEDLLGSVALVSSPMGEGPGPRFWFRDIRMEGEKLRVHPDRAIGPVIATFYSVSNHQLKLTAQFMPLAFADARTAVLEYKVASNETEKWKQSEEAVIISPGYSCLFRIPDWDDTKEFIYRIVYKNGDEVYRPYQGIIRRNPDDEDDLALAVFTGMSPMSRQPNEGGIWFRKKEEPGVGRWTPENIWMPQRKIVENVQKLAADILFFTGDEVYDNMPTAKDIDGQLPQLDFLWKWYIWCLTFRDLTRQIPSVVQVDDHDVFHGNIWGMAGRRNNPQTNKGYRFYVDNGGYSFDPEFVNMVQRVACGHNPDPFDPEPVLQGITTYYTSFIYGGVSFAVLEDRKFKSSPRVCLPETYPFTADGVQVFDDGHVIDPNYDVVKETPKDAVLLGTRQLAFLRKWAEEEPDRMKVCVSQGPFICAHTEPHGPGGKMDIDLDSGGWPKRERDQVVRILAKASALAIGGDQHLPYVAKLGVQKYDDGSYQFCVPSTGNYYSRWFYPAKPGIGHQKGMPPYTGGFQDGFGNKFTMLAVGNPVLGKKVVEGRYGFGNDGFGLVRVNKKKRVFRIECWPWNAKPELGDREQFEGWPIEVKLK